LRQRAGRGGGDAARRSDRPVTAPEDSLRLDRAGHGGGGDGCAHLWSVRGRSRGVRRGPGGDRLRRGGGGLGRFLGGGGPGPASDGAARPRSEERRVGKEG